MLSVESFSEIVKYLLDGRLLNWILSDFQIPFLLLQLVYYTKCNGYGGLEFSEHLSYAGASIKFEQEISLEVLNDGERAELCLQELLL